MCSPWLSTGVDCFVDNERLFAYFLAGVWGMNDECYNDYMDGEMKAC